MRILGKAHPLPEFHLIKRGNRWKRYRNKLGVQNHSQFYDRNCDDVIYQEASKWRRKRKKTIRRHCTSWKPFPDIGQKIGTQLLVSLNMQVITVIQY